MDTQTNPASPQIPKETPKKTLPISLMVAAILLIIAVVIVRNPFKKTTPAITPTIYSQKQTTSLIPTKVIVNEGSLTLKIGSGSAKKDLDKDFVVNVLADSKGKDIVGYDVIVEFDAKKLDFVRVDSTLPDFTIYKQADTGKLSLTGVKKIASNSINILSGQAIVSLTFKAKASGVTLLSIIKEKGKEVSELIDKDTKTYYPSVNSINLEIL